MEKPSHPKDNKLPVPQQNDQGFMPPSASPNFGSYHSPYVMNYGNDNSINKYSIPSANGGSLHNYFGRSPPTFLMSGGMTPLQSLLNSQHRIESPQFVQGTSPNFGRTHYQDLMADVNDIRNDCRSEGRSSVMSSLSEASIGDLEETKPKESLKNPNPPTILNKNADSISHKDMTMENVHPAKASQVFEDISIQPNSIDNQAKPVIEKPQIAEELEKEKKVKFEEVKQAEESKEPPAQLPKPRKKRKKLEKKKRSKSWDEEAAKQEQKRRENLEKKKGSLAVRKDVVNKTLLRSIKRLIGLKFEEQSKIKELNSKQQKDKFLQLIEGFISHYFPCYTQVITVEDNPNEEDSKLSQNGIKFIVGLLVNPKLLKSHFKSVKERTFFYLFQNLLRKYSHRKLLRLMSNQNFIFVVASLRENGGLEEIIESDQTCNRNKQAYYEAANNFINRVL
ncbi:unnamed protein product [Moneuplotes crassus]|uniref:Uncharacterized protein n=1 Tax=Euplotes crassus TaxID=5936 RepID=A0AAD1UE43_EUPCR|nr:unnamed protein product [Moneuplotes crassus]